MASSRQTTALNDPPTSPHNTLLDTSDPKQAITNKHTDTTGIPGQRHGNRKRRFSRQQNVRNNSLTDGIKYSSDEAQFETVSELDERSSNGITTTSTTSKEELPLVTATVSNSISPSLSSSLSSLVPTPKVQDRSIIKSSQVHPGNKTRENQNNLVNEENCGKYSKTVTRTDNNSNSTTVSITNSTTESTTVNGKAPESNIRHRSSARSALSHVFDISQNQSIIRSTSASSRCESRQAKFHKDCLPVEDPNLKVENWSKLKRERSPRTVKFLTSPRPGRDVLLLERRRESVTNFVFAGESNIDERDPIFWQRLRFYSSNSVGGDRMSSLDKEYDVTPGEFNIIVDKDYSRKRQSNYNASSPIRRTRSQSPRGAGFLYQVTDFDNLTKDVPPFVKAYAQKNGRMITETFILRLNFLRRRRQLGESSGNININISNINSQGHNTANTNSPGKKTPVN